MYAETEQRIHTDHEDLFTGLIKFASGAVGLLEINWLTPTKVRKLTVTGERGMYEADYLKLIDDDLLWEQVARARGRRAHRVAGDAAAMRASGSAGSRRADSTARPISRADAGALVRRAAPTTAGSP